MAVQVVMPKLGMAMTEGQVVQWLKEDGARVEEGEPLVKVMSKKITYEVRAPASGVLRIVVPVKGTAPVGGVIGFILAEGEEMPAVPAPAPTPAQASPPPAEEVLATPAAKRLARQHGVDLRAVRGTGAGGRITEADVQAYLEQQRGVAAAPAPPPARTLPFTGMRQAIAERMVESLRTMAQVTLMTEADVTALVDLVERLRSRGQEYTYTAFLVRACALALRRHPQLNSTLVGEEIRLLEEIHIGVGVALEEGLIVPVIRHADRLSVAEIDRELQRLARAAREGTLTVDEVTGSTFTLSNLGMYGVDAFTPIINPPECAILGVGRIVERPAVHRGRVEVRSQMALSLTFDHRLVDGAPAARFLSEVRELLEQPAFLVPLEG